MSPSASIPTKIPIAVLPLTIPLAVIPRAVAFDTCNPSTIEPSPERTTPSLKFPEIDPFLTVMPVVLPPASIATGNGGGIGPGPTGEVPVIVKPARSMVTKLAVIDRQALPEGPLKVRFLTS